MAGAPGSAAYQRHRPEATLLYQLVEPYYADFRDHLAAQGCTKPRVNLTRFHGVFAPNSSLG